MKLKMEMHKNSIFAVLLRSPWWISAGVAAGIFTAGRLALPEAYALYAFFAALPFMVISGYAGWHQFRAPSEAVVAEALDAIRALAWSEFSVAIEDALRREGHTVVASNVAGADYELVKAGRIAVLGCKRWKAARTGVEPLRELDSARRTREAHEAIYIATGEISEPARAFAAGNGIRLVQDVELARLLPKPRGMQKR